MNSKIMNILAAVVAIITFSGTAIAREDVGVDKQETERFIVNNDGGGVVDEYMEALTFMKGTKMPVSVSGYCASACTLLLSDDYKLDLCIEPDVRFGFHKPYPANMLGQVSRTVPNIVRAEKLWLETFYGKYPDWVKKLIDKNGGVPSVIQGDKPSDVLWLTFDDMKTHIKMCAQKPEPKKVDPGNVE